MFRVFTVIMLALPLLMPALNQSWASCRSPIGDYWFTVDVVGSFEEKAIPGVLIQHPPKRTAATDTFPEFSYRGEEPLVLIESANSHEFRTFQERAAWVQEFKDILARGGAKLLKENWRESRPLEDEKSTRMLLEVFHAIPKQLIQNGRTFWPYPDDYYNSYSKKFWVESDAQPSWRYPGYKLFSIPHEDNRPSDIAVPATLSAATEVLIWKGEPFFIKEVATFALNPLYSSDAHKRRKANFVCNDVITFPSYFLIWPILSIIGAGISIFGTFKAIAWVFSKLRREV